jgi:CheY-like chemotaxis protein
MNAFRFTPPGGHVRVEMEVKQHRVFVCVHDDGRGADPRQLASALDAFRAIDSHTGDRDGGGLGLGLSIANFIVREHHGTLRIDSPGPGRGATVTIELPLAEPAAGPTALSRGSEALSGEQGLAGVRVLLVEDDTDEREVLTEMLTAEGARVCPSPSAKAALQELSDFSPDVIVSDIGMHDEDGRWLIQEVRSRPPPLGKVPAVALTARGHPEEAQAAKDAGYQRCLPKPPEPRALTEAIAKLGGPHG